MDDRRKERRLFDTALINPTSSHLTLAYFEKKPFISICKKPEKIRHYFRRVQRVHLSGFEFNFNDFSQSTSLLYQLTMEKDILHHHSLCMSLFINYAEKGT